MVGLAVGMNMQQKGRHYAGHVSEIVVINKSRKQQ